MGYYERGYCKYRFYKFNNNGVRYKVIIKINGIECFNYFTNISDVANFIEYDVNKIINLFGTVLIQGEIKDIQIPKFMCIIDSYTIIRETCNPMLQAKNEYKYIDDPMYNYNYNYTSEKNNKNNCWSLLMSFSIAIIISTLLIIILSYLMSIGF